MIQPKPSPVLRLVNNLLLIPLGALSTAFFGCISLVCGLWDKSGRQQHFIARVWARTLLHISLSPVTLIDEQHLRTHPVAVYASNHLSYMDTPVLFATLPSSSAFSPSSPSGRSPSSAGTSTAPDRSPSTRSPAAPPLPVSSAA